MAHQRLYQIIKTFLEYGLDDLIPKKLIPWYIKLTRHSFFWLKNQHKEKSEAQRLRLAIESLGPVFIKFGQMLSTRRDLLPDPLANELALLQDQVPAFSGQLAKDIVITELGEDIFNHHIINFNTIPLASASIAQVHTASLRQGEKSEDIIIKVLRPGIKSIILADLTLMEKLARLAAQWLPDGKRLRPVEIIAEYKKTILDELDLNREAANAARLRANFNQGHRSDNILYVPKVYPEFSRENMLLMERIYGASVGNIEYLQAKKVNMKLLAERGVEVFFTQVFRDSFFHADMHAGNVYVDITTPENPTWIAIDFGIVGTLNTEDKRYLAGNFVAFFNGDYRKVAQLHVDSGWVPKETNIDDFELAIKTVCQPIFNKPLSEISFGQVLLSLFNTARQFNMQVQPQLVLLQKTLLYIEGLGRQLYPQLDLWQTAKPYLENWVNEQMGIKTMINKVKENLPYWCEKFPEMPELLYQHLKESQAAQQQQIMLLTEIQQQQQKQSKRLNSTIICISIIIGLLLFLN